MTYNWKFVQYDFNNRQVITAYADGCKLPEGEVILAGRYTADEAANIANNMTAKLNEGGSLNGVK